MGLIIPGYVVENLIKEGGFAQVYKVKRLVDKKILAVKIMNEKSYESMQNRKLFYWEAKLLQKFDHPNIVKFDSVEKKAPRPAIVMEYFENETLKSLILNSPSAEEQHPLIQQKGIGMMRKIAETLKYMHSLNIIHKDIKPENILVNKEGDVRLVDFNIAEKIDFLSRFKIRKRKGTALYMSPEQVRKLPLDARSDVYSLGVTFYETFCGKAYIKAPSEKAVLQKVLKGSIVNPRKIMKNIPYQVDNLLMRMLAKKAEDRHQSMHEVLFELNKFSDTDNLTK